MDRIVFLGTAGDSSVMARQLRASGGIVLQIGEMQMHIDPGPGSLVRAREFGVNPRATGVMLVSHNHVNHAHDVNAVVHAMTLGGFDKKGVLIANTTVVQGNGRCSPTISTFAQSCIERIIVLQPGQKAAVEDVEVHAIPAFHSDSSGIGFRILAPLYTIGYSGDTAFSKEAASALEGCDILILNVTFPDALEADGHLNREGAQKVVEQVKPKLVLITHFGFEMLKADPLLEARHIQLATGVQTVAAHDGLSIVPATYAARSEQARLSGFLPPL